MHRIFIMAALLSTAPAWAETPQSLWQEIPLLPASAENADCSAVDDVTREIEYAGEEALMAAQRAMMSAAPMGAFSDRQSQALERVMDYSLQECANEIENMRQERFEQPVEELKQKVYMLGEQKLADAQECGNEYSQNYDGCMQALGKRYESRGRAEANQFLGKLRSPYGEWSKKVKSCIDNREAAFAEFQQAKVGGPFAGQGLNARVQTWMLAHLQAKTSGKLCNAVYEAAHAMDTNSGY